ncbi:TPA: portal protein [Candidatus Woesearchaeota archaeon]|nr:portal protein [Candidatus Woesearchaeota archaeon]|tara:strand:- start:125 stop:1654 length:1530 start_codon:yes stop_codon:yes gene_type:complete
MPEFFGFSFGRKKDANKVGIESTVRKPVSFVPPDYDDGATTIEAGNFFGQYVDFDGNIRNDIELIKKYREMSLHAEVDSAIDDIINESIVQDDIKRTVQMDLDLVDLSDTVKESMQDEFNKILKLLHFSVRGYEIFRKWYIDGKMYFHIVIDPKKKKQGIQELRPVDATTIRKIRKVEKEMGNDGIKVIKDVEEFFVYTDQDRDDRLGGVDAVEGIKINTDSIIYVHSGMYDVDKKRVFGNLQKIIKPLNQLRMIEDAVVIYRISRAPERRIFYIDVGSLPKNKAEQYLRDIMNRYRNKLVYDVNTGEIRDDKRHMSMLEDFWLPRREGGRGTEIDTLQGGENLGEMEDVEYFKKKLYRALNVPISRLEADNGFNMGRSSEITRDELKFFKFIEKQRTKFSELFLQALRVQLVLRGIMKEDEWEKIKDDVKFEYARDSYFTELKNNEILNERMNLLGQMNEHIGKYYSLEWIRKNVLNQTEEEIKEMDAQIENEREKGIISTGTTEDYY